MRGLLAGRDWEEYSEFRKYIHMNPMRAQLCDAPELYPYSSAGNGFVLDDCQRLLSQASKILPLTSGAKALDF